MHERDLIEADVEGYLARHEQKELVRIFTCGSVDDGKSTLIGRLLFDSSAVYDDQLAALRKDSERRSTTAEGEFDYSLLVDGLLSEREQGITIDVAYRYFSTPARKFIIADTPGHEQYTRNMATGASTAELAILLVDARQGLLPQTRRHSAIVSLLGIRHVVLAVNKMDLVGWDGAVFEGIRRAYGEIATRLGIEQVQAIPVSALKGDNVVKPSERTPYYEGPPLLRYLESAPVARGGKLEELRLPVQYVIRPNLDFRGFAGTIASGEVKKGDRIVALPSGRSSRVRSVVTGDGELEAAEAPLAVTVTLEDEIDVSRGDVLVREGDAPHVERGFEATLVWMHERPMRPGSGYLLKHGTRTVGAEVTALHHRLDVANFEEKPAEALSLNDIGRVSVVASRPIVFDAYESCRATGAFILIDRMTNATVGAGMILGPSGSASGELASPDGRVSAAERARRLGQRAVEVAFAGGDPALAAFLAVALERRLFDEGYATARLSAESLARGGAEADLGLARRLFLELALISVVDLTSLGEGGPLRALVASEGESPAELALDPSADPDASLRAVMAELRRRGVLR